MTRGPRSSAIGERGEDVLLPAGLLGQPTSRGAGELKGNCGLLGYGGEGNKWAAVGEEERVGRMTGKGEERKRNSFLFS